MARSFFYGLLAGGGFAAVGLGALSIVSDPPQSPEITETAPQTSAALEADADAGLAATLPARQDADAPETEASVAAAPALDTDIEVPSDVETAGVPEAPDVEVPTLTQPTPPKTAETVALPTQPGPDVDAPVEPALSTQTLPDPAPVETAEVAAENAPRTAPQMDIAAAGYTGVVREVGGDIVAASGVEPVRVALPGAPTAPLPTDVPNVSSQPAALPAPDPEPEAQQQVPEARQVAAVLKNEDLARPGRDQAVLPPPLVVLVPSQEDAAPAVSTEPFAPRPTEEVAATQPLPVLPQQGREVAQDARPQIGRPALSLLDRGGEPTEPVEETTVAAQPDADDDADPRAIVRSGVPHDATDARPLLSIVLLDDGQALAATPAGIEALASFPYPITFAVDASLPDAADRAARYRAQGFEVLATIDVPEAFTATDTETVLSVALEAVPNAVGVMEGLDGGLQGNRAISDQVTAILRDTGHGIIWQPNGLDTAAKLAAREGVPSETLFRDLDAAGQSPTVIRRFLDNAAFRARQLGGVVMMGRIRPDTISALLIWGLADRAQRVSVAPVSAVLLRSEEG